MRYSSKKRSEVPNIIKGYPYDHILKVSCQYLHLLQSYKGRKIYLLRVRESRAERAEEKDNNTHLAEISSAGQGLCNWMTMVTIGPA